MFLIQVVDFECITNNSRADKKEKKNQQHITIPKFQAINGFSCLSNIWIEYLPSKSESERKRKHHLRFEILSASGKMAAQHDACSHKKSEIEALEMG